MSTTMFRVLAGCNLIFFTFSVASLASNTGPQGLHIVCAILNALGFAATMPHTGWRFR